MYLKKSDLSKGLTLISDEPLLQAPMTSRYYEPLLRAEETF